MLDSNTILGVRGYLNCEEYDHGILTQNWERWPLGAPVVYSRAEFGSDESGSATRILSLISPSQQAAGSETVTVYTKNIVPVDLKPLHKYHKVLNIDRFDIDKLDRLIEFIHDVGAISLVIDSDIGRKHISADLRKLSDVFKYNTLFYYNRWGSKHLAGKDDVYSCVLTFLDIPYCIPLFNTHKVDGIGLSVSGVTHKQSIKTGVLNRVFKAEVIYSNYADNLLVIDGVDVNEDSPIGDSMFREIADVVNRELAVGPPISSNKKKRMLSSDKEQEPEKAQEFGQDFGQDSKWVTNFTPPASPPSEFTKNIAIGEVEMSDAPISSGEVAELYTPSDTLYTTNDNTLYHAGIDGIEVKFTTAAAYNTETDNDDNNSEDH